ncbi:hypothetical protein WJX74_005850 [Apatococcus lobatus]|uniref:Uncharacterized protein n=1 Tax=Apatococcus lobatus TaxID=904363 RepID=A0AAW1QI39_9CHLO
MERLTRTVYRGLLRGASTFDQYPALKALICRDHGPQLTDNLDQIVAAFLGGSERQMYVPSPMLPQSVLDATRMAFRFPPGQPSIDEALMGLRYLQGLLSIGAKHGLMAAAAVQPGVERGSNKGPLRRSFGQTSSRSGGLHPETSIGPVELQAMPSQGALLLAHPCLSGSFNRAVVLLCRHRLDQGSYGLIVNRTMQARAKVQLLQHMHSRGVALNDATAYAAAHVFEQMSAMAPLRSSMAADGAYIGLPVIQLDTWDAQFTNTFHRAVQEYIDEHLPVGLGTGDDSASFMEIIQRMRQLGIMPEQEEEDSDEDDEGSEDTHQHSQHGSERSSSNVAIEFRFEGSADSSADDSPLVSGSRHWPVQHKQPDSPPAEGSSDNETCKVSRWRNLQDVPSESERVLEVVLEPGEEPASGTWRGHFVEHVRSPEDRALELAAVESNDAAPSAPETDLNPQASSPAVSPASSTMRTSSHSTSGAASLGPSNTNLTGIRQQPASIPRACLRQQGDGLRPISLVPSHQGSTLNRILSRLPIAQSPSQPQLPVISSPVRPTAAFSQNQQPVQPSETPEASAQAPAQRTSSHDSPASKPAQLASSLEYPDRQHWHSGDGVTSLPAEGWSSHQASGVEHAGKAETQQQQSEETRQSEDKDGQARREHKAKKRQREVEISKLILEKVQQQHRADPAKLQKKLQAFAQEEIPKKQTGRSSRRASETDVLFRAMSLPTSAGLKLVGDPLIGRVLEHQQLSCGGPVESTQVLHSRPELGGEEVTPASSSSPGIYLGVDPNNARQQHAEGRLAAEDLRLLIGEATWQPTQLEAELSTGCWIVVKTDLSQLNLLNGQQQCWWPSPSGSVERMLSPPADIYQQLLSGLGPEYAQMAQTLTRDRSGKRAWCKRPLAFTPYSLPPGRLTKSPKLGVCRSWWTGILMRLGTRQQQAF